MRIISIAAALLVVAGLSAGTGSSACAEQLRLELVPSPSNPPAPRMGDGLTFRAVIRNDGQTPISGIIAWITLLQVDPGKEQAGRSRGLECREGSHFNGHRAGTDRRHRVAFAAHSVRQLPDLSHRDFHRRCCRSHFRPRG